MVCYTGSVKGRGCSSSEDTETILDGLSVKSKEALRRHVHHVHLARPDARYDELIEILPSIRSVPKTTVVELFFRRTIGQTPIEPFVCGTYTNYLQTAPHLQTIISKAKICHCLQWRTQHNMHNIIIWQVVNYLPTFYASLT